MLDEVTRLDADIAQAQEASEELKVGSPFYRGPRMLIL